MDEAVEDLLKTEEAATIYITRPLRRRTVSHVLQATKEIYAQLKQCGLHVSQLHSDRAREFRGKAFQDWTVEAEIRHTRTAGGDPAGNSTAELGIKWAKGRVRAFIKGANAHPSEWPMAVAHASASLWAKVFPDTPWAAAPATTFGNEVWFRSKIYQGKAEKKHDAAGTRWKRGWYRGPTLDVKRGHLIMREDGGLTVAKSVKYNVVDPSTVRKDLLSPVVAEGLPEELLEDEYPPTKQEIKDEVEFRSRKLIEDENYELDQVVSLYSLLETLGDSDRRLSKKTSSTSWYTGAYVHGGVAGIRSNLGEYPQTTKYLTKVAKHYGGDIKFSALGLVKNTQLGLHRDLHNYAGSTNYVLPLTNFGGGSLWVQEDVIEDGCGETRTTPTGKQVAGRMLAMKKGEITSFPPRRWHQVQPWEGDRVVMLLYTPRATKLAKEAVEELLEFGFNVDDDSLKATAWQRTLQMRRR